MPVEPEAPMHGMVNAVTPQVELAPGSVLPYQPLDHWQLIIPSAVAGASTATDPANRAQVSGNDAG